MRKLILLILISSCQERTKEMPTQKFNTVCVDGFVYYTWQGANYATNITPKIGQGGVFITCGEPLKDGL